MAASSIWVVVSVLTLHPEADTDTTMALCPRGIASNVRLSTSLDAARAAVSELRGAAESFCSDTVADCGAWARAGECERNSAFMHGACKASCAACVATVQDRQNHAEVALIAIRHALAAWTIAGSPEVDLSRLQGHETRLTKAVFTADITSELQAIAGDVEAFLAILPAGSAMESSAPLSSLADGHQQNVSTAVVQLRGGGEIPALGFGTWMLTGQAAYDAVLQALKLGYRHIDTSQNYANEEFVGRALRDSGIARDDIFLATKLSHRTSFGAGNARRALEQQLKDLGVEYVDLYMLHGPHSDERVMRETWGELEQAVRDGLVRYLGVSNFLPRDFRLLETFATIPPVTSQNKHSIYRQGSSFNAEGDDLLRDFRERGVVLTAYCTINAWPGIARPTRDGVVQALAQRLNRTAAQVLLRWVLQGGHTALTRSTKYSHALENSHVFDFVLPDEDMVVLDDLAWMARADWNRRPPEKQRRWRHVKEEL